MNEPHQQQQQHPKLRCRRQRQDQTTSMMEDGNNDSRKTSFMMTNDNSSHYNCDNKNATNKQQEDHQFNKRANQFTATGAVITNGNSDAECLRDDAGILRKFRFHLDTNTGFAMFNVTERIICHAILWVSLLIIFLYVIIFSMGFMNGIYDIRQQQQNSTVAAFPTTTMTQQEVE